MGEGNMRIKEWPWAPPPMSRSLTEGVEAVAKHQAVGFSPSTLVNSVAPLVGHIKGVTM